jgi:hypothetical protein
MWTPVICESADLTQWTLCIKHYYEIVASKPDKDGAIPWARIVDHNSELVPVQKLGWKERKKILRIMLPYNLKSDYLYTVLYVKVYVWSNCK